MTAGYCSYIYGDGDQFRPGQTSTALADRGLDFVDAAKVFEGATLTQEDDRFDYAERRFQTYGWLADRIVLVVWTPTDQGIRVISMRNCHDKESRRIASRLG